MFVEIVWRYISIYQHPVWGHVR